jgi:hypothetical protein
MRLLQSAFVLILVACGVAAYKQGFTQTLPQQQSTAPKPNPGPAAPAQVNPNQAVNDRYVAQILERIAGHENEPAEKVFKNIQLPLLKSTPAKRLLLIMNLGYSRALGVACTHCHVEQDFSSDDQRPKRAAREMAVMHKLINEQLQKMQNLEIKPEQRFINCSTCHRGAINPMASSG